MDSVSLLEEFMNISAQIRQSVHIITEYYENHLQPFFDAADDDLLWIGPAENQWMQGKSTILAAFAQEDGRDHSDISCIHVLSERSDDGP